MAGLEDQAWRPEELAAQQEVLKHLLESELEHHLVEREAIAQRYARLQQQLDVMDLSNARAQLQPTPSPSRSPPEPEPKPEPEPESESEPHPEQEHQEQAPAAAEGGFLTPMTWPHDAPYPTPVPTRSEYRAPTNGMLHTTQPVNSNMYCGSSSKREIGGVPETEAQEQLNGVAVPGTWYGQTGHTLKQERPMPSPIPPGTMVQLHSLSTEVLNDQIGECGALNEQKGRYSVVLQDGRTCGVRPANLRRPRSPSAAAAKRSAKLADEGLAMLSTLRATAGVADPMAFIALNKTLTQALELDPCCARAHQALGDACVLRDHTGANRALNAAAIKHFRRAAENGGGNEARFLLSGCLGRSGDLQGELKELRTILEVDPENVMCACSLGRLHQRQGRHEEALGELLRVLHSPETPKGGKLGQLSAQLGVSSAAALAREANETHTSANDGGFVGPSSSFVPVTGDRALELLELALHAYNAALPHLLGSGPEICYANQASALMDLG